MENFNFSNVAFDALVAERQTDINANTLFVTISPNPMAKVECIMKNLKTGKNRTVKRPYGMVPQRIQYQYCLKVLSEDYLPWLSDDVQLLGIAELNESGNVHFHMLINDKKIRNMVRLQVFRRDVLNGVRTQQNILRCKMNARDWMNNIVFVTKSERDILDYFMKDQDMMLPEFSNYYL